MRGLAARKDVIFTPLRSLLRKNGAGMRVSLRPEAVARATCVALALVVSAPSALGATESPPSVEAVAPPSFKDRFFDPADGQFDLSYFLEHPYGFIPVPIIVTEPAVGYGGGFAALFLRPRAEAGSEGWARPDISAVGGLATENGTWAAFFGDVSLWFDGRLRTLVGIGGGRVNLDFYGLGDGALREHAIAYSLNFQGAVGEVAWRLGPVSPWWVGVRYVYANTEPQLRDPPAFPGLLDRIRITVSAPTALLTFDSRNNIFTPTRGMFSETSYLVSLDALGATDEFTKVQEILMGWIPLASTLTLALRADAQAASDGTPFFLLPYVNMRGVPAVRYAGNRVATGQAELRWQFFQRWSVVAFGGVGGTRSDRGDTTFSQSVTAGGAGFRYELARKFGLQAGIDFAHSPGTNAFYIIVGNAWFRP